MKPSFLQFIERQRKAKSITRCSALGAQSEEDSFPHSQSRKITAAKPFYFFCGKGSFVSDVGSGYSYPAPGTAHLCFTSDSQNPMYKGLHFCHTTKNKINK